MRMAHRTKSIILDAFEDAETGEVGLGLPGMSRKEGANAATNGTLIAHDLLEHINGPREIGTIDDELEALGALWFVRGQFGILRHDNLGSRYSVNENIASDIVRMYRDYFYGAYVNMSRVRTMPCDHDLDFADILEHARVDIPQELDTGEKVDTRDIGAYLKVCLSRMRIGYRKAARKYKGEAHFINTLFWAVSDAVDPCTKHCEEGMQFELVYGTGQDGRPFARCDEYYPEEY
jgi:hypothetical protein